MKSLKKFTLLLLIALAGVSATARLREQEPEAPRQMPNRQEDMSQFPLVDASASEPDDPHKHEKRKARKSRYDKRGKLHLKVVEGTSAEANLHYFVGIPALPVQLDVVMLGTVEKAEAVLSNDKTGIYSEFTIRTEEVFKDYGSIRLMVGSQFVAEREGGRVRFPSGSIQYFKIAKQNMPRVGRRYVFFLKRLDENDTDSLFIITGYELREGRVYPLDGDEQNMLLFEKYRGFEEGKFIDILREAVVNPPQDFPR